MEEIIKQFANALAEKIADGVMARMSANTPPAREPERKNEDCTLRRGEVRGNKALARELNVSTGTICKYKREGILDDAIISEFRRIIIYDVSKAKQCLNHRTVAPGRPRIKR